MWISNVITSSFLISKSEIIEHEQNFDLDPAMFSNINKQMLRNVTSFLFENYDNQPTKTDQPTDGHEAIGKFHFQ